MAKVKEKFTVKNLFYDLTLQDVVSDETKFRLASFHNHDFSLIDLIPIREDFDQVSFQLLEEIYDQLETPDLKFRKPPKQLEIVLAPKQDEKYLHRAIVMAVDQDKCQLYFVDVGGTGTALVSELKPVNQEIMKYPRLSYAVKLQDVEPTSDLTLVSDFKTLMETLKTKKVPLTVTLGDKLGDSGRLIQADKVFVSYSPPGSSRLSTTLKKEITELGIWEWERSSNLKGTDEGICSSGKWKATVNRGAESTYFLTYNPGPEGTKIRGKVARILDENENDQVSNLRLVELDDPNYLDSFKVLHKQLERYSENIQPSDFYPTIGEQVLVRIVSQRPEVEKLKQLHGKWLRGMRLIKDLIYFIDYDEVLVLDGLDREDLNLRQLYMEFCRIPALCVTVRLTDKAGKPISVEDAKDLMKEGHRYGFRVGKEKKGKFEVLIEPEM